MLVSSVLAARTSHGSGRLAATLELNIDRYLVFTVNRVAVGTARHTGTVRGYQGKSQHIKHCPAELETEQVWYEKQERSLLDTAASNLRLSVSQQLQEQGINLQCTASIGQI